MWTWNLLASYEEQVERNVGKETRAKGCKRETRMSRLGKLFDLVRGDLLIGGGEVVVIGEEEHAVALLALTA
jgi:hypothetical protein